MFDRIEKRGKHNAIAVLRSPRAQGHFCNTRDQIDGSHSVVCFADICAALKFCSEDNLFKIGETIVKRTRGFPMGGPMSAAATCIDIEMDVASVAQGNATLKRVKWFVPSAPLLKSSQLVAGFQHVDDALVSSKICL